MSLEKLNEIYLDYFNNFLTVEGFANYYGLTLEVADLVIQAGRKAHKTIHS